MESTTRPITASRATRRYSVVEDSAALREIKRARSTDTTLPVDAITKTDILLLQYLSDIVLDAQTFELSASNTPGTPTLSSAASQSFTVGDPATSAMILTITDEPSVPVITAQNDIRIPEGFNMVWDDAVASVTLSGSAAGNVAFDIKGYEDFGRTVVLDVTSDFLAGDQLVVDGKQLRPEHSRGFECFRRRVSLGLRQSRLPERRRQGDRHHQRRRRRRLRQQARLLRLARALG